MFLINILIKKYTFLFNILIKNSIFAVESKHI